MNQVTANYSFDIHQENDGYRYQVDPKPYSWNLGIKLGLLIGFFLSFPIIGIADMKGNISLGVFLWIIIVSGIVYGILWLVNNLVRHPSTFFISDQKIEVRGKSYDRVHVSALFIKHPKKGVQEYGQGGNTFIVAGSSVGGVIASQMLASGMQLNREIGASLFNSINNYRYMLYFKFGEKKIKLAGGMTESASHLLFDKIIANHSRSKKEQSSVIQTA